MPPRPSDSIPVVCIVLVNPDRRILVTQRSENKSLAGCWEFPGGKIELGERAEEALRRELKEELNLEVGKLTPMTPVVHVYKFAAIRLIPFLSRCESHPEVVLREHSAYQWISLEEANRLDWAAADVPVLGELARLLM